MKQSPRQFYRWLPALLMLGGMLLAPGMAGRAQAQTDAPVSCQPSYPAERQVQLSCTGAWNGAVYIFNHQQVVDPAQPWEANASQADALWIFDARPTGQRALDGSASLLIDFRPDGAGVRADLYDDQNKDGRVAYYPSDAAGEPGIRENTAGLPTIRMSTSQGGWLNDGKVNYNLKIAIDGAVRGDFASDVRRYYDDFKTDGVIDFSIEVHDRAADGIADYELRDSPIPGNYIHSSLMVSNETRPTPLSDVLLWPLLSTRVWGFDQPYNTLRAPIQVDWAKAKLITIGEVVPSRGRPTNWFTYSINPIVKNQTTATNFEAPFAFYNLSGIDDGFPDLQVRFERFNPGEYIRDFKEPIQSMRYSWDQYHRQSWDYKIGLLGRNPISGTVQFDDFAITSLPYAEIPSWVMNNTWDEVNFVAHEGTGLYYSTEGIYDWSAQDDVRDKYIVGRDSTYSLAPFQQISAGFRGEYRIAPNSEPRLYFSPIDSKLHLYGAQGGLWNIGDGSDMRVADVNGDGYLDQWRYTRVIGSSPGVTTLRDLYVAPAHLIYSDGNSLQIKQATIQPAVFDARPPTNHEEWDALGNRLKANQRDFEPGNLQAVLQQRDGREQRVNGASIQDYRAIGRAGFRFVLALRPGFQAEGDDLLGLGRLAPGSYVVSYDGALHIVPLTPPQIAGQLLPPAPLKQHQPGVVQVALRNVGRADLPVATLELVADIPNVGATLVATQTVALMAQKPITATVQFTPNSAGDWALSARVRDPDNQLVSLAPLDVAVAPAETTPPGMLALLSAGPSVVLLSGLGLVAFVLIVTLVFWRQWRALMMERSNDRT